MTKEKAIALSQIVQALDRLIEEEIREERDTPDLKLRAAVDHLDHVRQILNSL